MRPAPSIVYTLLASCGLAGTLHAQAEPAAPRLDDFAFSVELSPREPRPLHTLLLPLAVYRGSRYSDLADVRVFNAAGEQVPHAVRTLDEEREVAGGTLPLPLFPLHASDETRAAGSLDGIALHVERDAAGTVIDIRVDDRPGGPPDAGTPAEVLGYVLDASATQRAIVALHIQFEATDRDFVLPVTVDASDDLSHFHRVTTGQALVQLEYAGQRIDRREIPLPATAAKYLRLRWPGQTLPAPIAAVDVELGAEREAAPRHTTRVKGRARAAEPGVFDFDLGGAVPVDALRVLLPEENSLVEVAIASAVTSDAAYEPVFRGAVYRIQRDAERIESPTIAFPRRAHRHFRMTVDGKGGGLASGVPELEVEYHPDQLLFVARGGAPFQLAYGHHADAASSFDPGELLAPLSKLERANLPRADTDVAAPRKRAGHNAYRAPPPPPPLKRYALWAVLIVAVAVVALAAYRVARGIGQGDGPPPPSS